AARSYVDAWQVSCWDHRLPLCLISLDHKTVETVLRLAYQLACNASWFCACAACDDEDMSPGPEAKRARIAKVTGVDVPVGNGKLTMYHSDEYLSECANDVAVADPFCNEDDSDEGPVSDDEDSSALNGAPPLELFFPFSTSDPELSESEMSHLAHVADQHEIARLERMGVLKPLEGDTAHYSQLSQSYGTTGAILLAADIADAYFTVAQEKPTVVTSMTVRVA
ncbi:unnamed protein product, partial [Symbiodinium microadriaticum]